MPSKKVFEVGLEVQIPSEEVLGALGISQLSCIIVKQGGIVQGMCSHIFFGARACKLPGSVGAMVSALVSSVSLRHPGYIDTRNGLIHAHTCSYNQHDMLSHHATHAKHTMQHQHPTCINTSSSSSPCDHGTRQEQP